MRLLIILDWRSYFLNNRYTSFFLPLFFRHPTSVPTMQHFTYSLIFFTYFPLSGMHTFCLTLPFFQTPSNVSTTVMVSSSLASSVDCSFVFSFSLIASFTHYFYVTRTLFLLTLTLFLHSQMFLHLSFLYLKFLLSLVISPSPLDAFPVSMLCFFITRTF